MKKISIPTEDRFEPYAIQIDTQRENDFLVGLLKGDPNMMKNQCKAWCPIIDADLYGIVLSSKTED